MELITDQPTSTDVISAVWVVKQLAVITGHPACDHWLDHWWSCSDIRISSLISLEWCAGVKSVQSLDVTDGHKVTNSGSLGLCWLCHQLAVGERMRYQKPWWIVAQYHTACFSSFIPQMCHFPYKTGVQYFCYIERVRTQQIPASSWGCPWRGQLVTTTTTGRGFYCIMTWPIMSSR